MRNKQSRKKNRKIKKLKTLKKNQKGGFINWLLGASKFRGIRYEHWLEERLILHYKDHEYVKTVRDKFNFKNTNIAGENNFINNLENRFNKREPEDKAIIMQQNIKQPMQQPMKQPMQHPIQQNIQPVKLRN